MTAITVIAWLVCGCVAGIALVPITRRVMTVQLPTTAMLAVSGVLTAALWGALAWLRPTWPELVVDSVFIALAVSLALVDVVEYRLPKLLVRSLYVASIGASIGVQLTDGDARHLLRAAIGMICLLLIYLVIAMTFPGDLGAGDVRLAGIIGWVLAWHSWATLLMGAVLGTFAGALLAVAVMITRHSHRGGHLPAGPTMLLGALGALMLAP
jgi:leader peptidase (prepilin peptidase) / N-methyltransferase